MQKREAGGMIQRLAKRVAETLGRESGVIRTLRPWYERALLIGSGGRGVRYDINGVTYRVDPRHRDRLGHAYDAPVAAFLRDAVRPGATCVNVGANVGIYVLQFAHWSAPDGTVIAFEPNPQAAAVLQRHVAMNLLGHRVRIVEAAVGAAPGYAELFTSGVAGMGRLGSPNPQLAEAKEMRVPVVTLDDHLAALGVEPDWLFIDIEGFEIQALLGARRLIMGGLPGGGIVVEMHPEAWADADTSRDEVEDLLRELGLVARPLMGQRDPLGEHGVVRLEP
jgi:FkbM family methyltransferase